jgi:hypothetical protein
MLVLSGKLRKGGGMGKAAENEVRKIRARFFNNLGVGCAVVGVAMMQAPVFLPSMREAGWKEVFGYIYPSLALFLLAWGWNAKAKKIAGEIED